MTLQTAFFEFPKAKSEAQELNQVMTRIRERFTATEQRIINVETVQPTTILGFQIKAGGLRVWYESIASQDELERQRTMSVLLSLFDEVNT